MEASSQEEDLTLTPPIPVQFQAASHFFVPLFAAVSAHRRVHLHTGPRGTREDAASRRREGIVLRTAHRPVRQRLWL